MIPRDEIALRILCALVSRVTDGDMPIVGENEARAAFAMAQSFERVSDEIGGKPVRVTGSRWRGHLEDDD